jgi:mono/diheme cytochrome c family protein
MSFKILFVLFLAGVAISAHAAPPDVSHGAYLVKISGCVQCHTVKGGGDSAYLAGGRPLKTSFGTFYAPNITSDKKSGIGSWSEAQFALALRHGRMKNHKNYYPAFPYTSFTKITDADVADIKAYLDTVPAIEKNNRMHEVKKAYSRFAVNFWKALYFRPGPFQNDTKKSALLNRGAYLVEGPMHCAECHTPRDSLGGLRAHMNFAGLNKNVEFEHGVPNITRDQTTGLGSWSRDDYDHFFTTGETPNGDDMSGDMKEVIGETKTLTPEDRQALIEFMMNVPAIKNKVDDD